MCPDAVLSLSCARWLSSIIPRKDIVNNSVKVTNLLPSTKYDMKLRFIFSSSQSLESNATNITTRKICMKFFSFYLRYENMFLLHPPPPVVHVHSSVSAGTSLLCILPSGLSVHHRHGNRGDQVSTSSFSFLVPLEKGTLVAPVAKVQGVVWKNVLRCFASKPLSFLRLQLCTFAILRRGYQVSHVIRGSLYKPSCFTTLPPYLSAMPIFFGKCKPYIPRKGILYERPWRFPCPPVQRTFLSKQSSLQDLFPNSLSHIRRVIQLSFLCFVDNIVFMKFLKFMNQTVVVSQLFQSYGK